MKKLDTNLNKLALSALNQNDKIYIVGGFIRNTILNTYETDIDLCGTPNVDVIIKLAQSVGYSCQIVNERLGTVLLTGFGQQYEYTPFRKETYQLGGYHRPNKVEFVKDINEDMIRRDFTVNAIYYDIVDDKIIDPFHGQKDIQKRLLRCIVSPRFVFSSDGLRILRLVRLASELNFNCEKNTFNAAKKYAFQLKDISKDRIVRELKLMITSDTKSIENIDSHVRAIKLLNKLKLWRYIFNSDFKHFSVKTSGVVFDLFKKSKPENRFDALIAVLFYNIYHTFHFNDELIIFYLQSLLGEDGLKLKKSINNIKPLLFVLRDIYSKKQSNYEYNRHCIHYENLSDENKKILKCAFDMGDVEKKVLELFHDKIPFKLSDINITSSKMIDIGIANRNISKVYHILMFELVSGAVKNVEEDIVDFIQSSILNKKNIIK